MRRSFQPVCTYFALLVALFTLAASGMRPLAAAAPHRLRTAYSRLPLSFEANQGQVDRRVRFLSRGSGYTVLLTPTEAVLQLAMPAPALRSESSRAAATRRGDPSSLLRNPKLPNSQTPKLPHPHTPAPGVSLHLRLEGADSRAPVEAVDRLPGAVNYLVGQDPAKWRTHIPTYGRVRYRSVYPGVDLVYYGSQGQLEYDFNVAPGADPDRIRLSISGADHKGALWSDLDPRGDLRVHTTAGTVVQHRPRVYQVIQGRRVPVAGSYRLRSSKTTEVSFRIGAYDRSRPLVIDPTLSYGALFGTGNASGAIYPTDLAVDGAGNAYLLGDAFHVSSWPGIVSQQLGPGASVFVAKLNPLGTALLYVTFLGSSAGEIPSAIAVDGSGEACVTGVTFGADFPTTSGAFQTQYGGGGSDAFVAKLKADGSDFVFSTYLGGSGTEDTDGTDDGGGGIAADAAGYVYVTGNTTSTDFPLSSPFESANATFIGFVAKFDPTGTVVYSSLLGGATGDSFTWGLGIAADSSGSAYVTGFEFGPFPTVNGIQAANQGNEDAFVAEVEGNELVYATLLGGSGQDQGTGIAVDSSGVVTVTGFTTSTDFPTKNAVQPQIGGGQDAFVARLMPDGSPLLYSTYLGGGADEDPGMYGIGKVTVDSSRNAWVVGTTESPNFPVTANAVQSSLAGSPLRKSTNAASTWVLPSAQPDTPAVQALAWSGSTLYAGSLTDGVFRSADGGQTWTQVNSGLTSLDISELAGLSNAVVAVTGFATGNQAFTLTGGGTQWSPVPAIDGAYLLASGPTALYASTGPALFESGDGMQWTPVILPQGALLTAFAVDPTNAAAVLAVTASGVIQSTNSGQTWNPTTGLPGPPDAVAIRGSTAYAALNGGTYSSTDGGSTWTFAGSLGSPNVETLLISASSASTVFAATGGGVLTSVSSGSAWTLADADLDTSAVYTLAADPASPQTLYAGTNRGSAGFVTEFDTAGDVLFSSFLGGGGDNVTLDVGMDPAGNLYVGGSTVSLVAPGTFPVTPGTLDSLAAPDSPNFFAVKLAVQSATFSISGTVTEAGKGVARVTVQAGAFSMTTAADGTYTITGVPAAAYTVIPSMDGLAFTPVNRAVTVSAANVTGVNFTATEAFYTLSGTVTQGGTGVSGVTVSAGGRKATTLSTGAYSIPGLPAGTYTVLPSKRDFGFTPPSLSVTITDANVPGVNFTAALSRFSISGVVTLNNVAVDGVTIEVSGAAGAVGGTLTAGTGAYTVSGLPPGTYTVTPSKPGQAYNPATRTVKIATADVAGVDFAALPTYSISGTIVIAPTPDGETGIPAGAAPQSTRVPRRPAAQTFAIIGTVTQNGMGVIGATVQAVGKNGSGQATTDIDGNYNITPLAAGVYTVTPNKAGVAFQPGSQSVTITNTGVGGVDFTVATIGLEGINVSAGGHKATTNALGAFTISGLLAGTYKVKASSQGFYFAFTPANTSVTVTNANVSGVQIMAVILRYTISGTITGSRPAGSIPFAEAGGEMGYANIKTGDYTITGLTAGTYTVAPNVVGGPGGGVVGTPLTRTVTLGPKNATGVSFSTVLGYAISGTVHDAQGHGVADVAVTLPGSPPGMTDVNGNFADVVPAGTYVVTPQLTGYTFTPPSVTVTVPPMELTVNFTANATAGNAKRAAHGR